MPCRSNRRARSTTSRTAVPCGARTEIVWVATARLSFIPAAPASRGSQPRARAIARTASRVVTSRLVNRTNTCSPSPSGEYAGISSTTKSSGRALMVPEGLEAPAPCSTDFMRHLVARASKVLLRRIEKKIADARGVEARVLFDLRSEARFFVLLFEQRPPKRVKSEIDSTVDGSKLTIHLSEPATHPVDAVLDAHAFALDLRARRAVCFGMPAFEPTREVFEAR